MTGFLAGVAVSMLALATFGLFRIFVALILLPLRVLGAMLPVRRH